MSSDGKLLATGDRNGNLRVHSMETWEQITYQEAHDSEILAMDLTHPSENGNTLHSVLCWNKNLCFFSSPQKRTI